VGYIRRGRNILCSANSAKGFFSSLLAQHGIRRQRAEEEDDNVIVFAEGYYAIFDIEEVLILLGVVPKVLFRVDP